MRTIAILLVMCSAVYATEPPKRPAFIYGLQEPVCINGQCSVDNYGLGSRLIRRQFRRAPVVQTYYGLPDYYQTSTPVVTPVEAAASVVGVTQYSEPILPVVPTVVETYHQPSPPMTVPVASYQVGVVQRFEPVIVETSTGNMYQCQSYETRAGLFARIRERRRTLRQAWRNRPGILGWRMR